MNADMMADMAEVYANDVRETSRRLAMLKAEYEHAMGVMHPGGMRYGERAAAGRHDAFEGRVIELDGLLGDYREEARYWEGIVREFRKTVNGIQDAQASAVLLAHYVYDQPLKSICMRRTADNRFGMGLSYSAAKRLRRDGLAAIYDSMPDEYRRIPKAVE